VLLSQKNNDTWALVMGNRDVIKFDELDLLVDLLSMMFAKPFYQVLTIHPNHIMTSTKPKQQRP
jgi:hypothetical protein